jgi:hypothetical protein
MAHAPPSAHEGTTVKNTRFVPSFQFAVAACVAITSTVPGLTGVIAPVAESTVATAVFELANE